MKRLIFLLTVCISIASYGQSKTVVVLPSKDTTEVTFNVTTTTTTSSSITVKPTVPTTQPPDVPPPIPGYQLTFENDFAQASDLVTDQLGLGSFVIKDGVGAFKSKVNASTNTSSGWRSEQQYTQTAANPTEGAIEYEVNFETLLTNSGHSFQLHPNTSGESASPGLWHVDGKFDLVNAKRGNTHHPTGISVLANHWYKIRFEYKMGTSGYWRTYLDGTLITNGSWIGQVGDNSGSYLKIGQNRWDVTSESVAYYRNLKVFKKI